MNKRIIIAIYFAKLILSLIISKGAGETFLKGSNYATLRGSTMKMECAPAGYTDLKLMGDETFIWTDEEGRELFDSRFIKLPYGALKIITAHVSDSGQYKCKIRSQGSSRIFEHKFIVYEISGHKFVSTAFFDITRYSVEVIRSLLKDLLTVSVCGQELCKPGKIKPLKCEISENREKQACKFLIPYEALSQIADEKCPEDCVRNKMIFGLRKAERILEEELKKGSREENGRLKPDLRSFETQHLITCEAGFHLLKDFFKRCFPCTPGYYSRPNSVTCTPCTVGTYQEQYGKRECEKCDADKTTESIGSVSRDECVTKENTGILRDLRESIGNLLG